MIHRPGKKSNSRLFGIGVSSITLLSQARICEFTVLYTDVKCSQLCSELKLTTLMPVTRIPTAIPMATCKSSKNGLQSSNHKKTNR